MAATLVDPTKPDIQMEILDTLHDFCKSERGDGDAAGDKRITWMRGYIESLLKKRVTGFSAKTFPEILKGLSNDKVTAISKLEHQTVDYFEDDHQDLINAKLETKETITYDAILDAWNADPNEKTNKLWVKYRINQDNTILEINKGKKYNTDSFTTAQKRIVANFLLNYFFGQTLLSRGGAGGIGAVQSVRVTFDAKTGLPGKIFTETEQVKNIMFPQTIADSATTSLNILKGRNEYIFPENGKTSSIESNTLTKSDYELKYVNSSFSKKNPFGFSLEIKNKQKNQSITAPFGSNQTEGPSVNYIIDILKLASTTASPNFKTLEKNKKSNILSIGKAIDANPAFKTEFVKKVKENTDALMPDIKRSGDHEAAIIARKTRQLTYEFLIFITIDILCALKSRREKNPTIWHCVDRLVLYRFPLSAEASAAARLQSLILQMQNTVDLLDKIITVKEGSTITSLDRQKASFVLGKNGFFKLKKSGKPSEIFAESIVTLLGRLRMYELEKQVDVAKTKIVPEFSPAKINEFKTKRTTLYSLVQDATATPPRVQITIPAAAGDSTAPYKGTPFNISSSIKSVQDDAKAFREKLQDALDIEDLTEQFWDTSTKSIMKKLTFEKTLIEQKASQTGGTKNVFVEDSFPLFQYYPEVFIEFYEKLVNLHTSSQPASWTGSRKQILTFEKALSEYESYVNTIMEQFPENSDLFQQITDILTFERLVPVFPQGASGDAKKAIRSGFIRSYIHDEASSLLTDLKTLASSAPYSLDITELTFTPARAGGRQEGGAVDPILQTYDLSYLLFEVASKASGFLESAFMEHYPQFTLYDLHSQLVDDYNTHYKDDLQYLVSSFRTLYTITDIYIQKASSPAERVKFTAIADPYVAGNYDTKDKLLANMDKIKELLQAKITGLTRPTMEEFFTKLSTDESLEGALTTYTDMLLSWEIGFKEIEYNDAYDYVGDKAGDRAPTERLISYLLSLEEDGTPLYAFQDADNLSSQETIKTALLSVFTDNPKKRFLLLLFVFAALENIMNVQKTNVFISTVGNKKNQFSAPEQWKTNLWNYLSNATTHFSGELGTAMPIAVPEIMMGGKHKTKYAKQTRRMQRKLRKMKRNTKRSHRR